MTMNKLRLFRGLPGSGKNYQAHQGGAPVFSADDFFLHDGIYQFDLYKIGQAHNQCIFNALQAIQRGDVAVANTFTQYWELLPYLAFPAEIQVIRVGEVTEEAARIYHARQVHGVPWEAMLQMVQRWEPFAGEMVLLGTQVEFN
jgi:hypothetical protein